MRARLSLVGEVGEDAQARAAAAQLRQGGCHPLHHGVDGVGPHGVAGVHHQVHHQHVAAAIEVGVGAAGQRCQHARPHIDHAATALHEPWAEGVGLGDQRRVALPQRAQGRGGVRHIEDLHLSHQEGWVGAGGEAAAVRGQARQVRAGRHHAWLLHRHGHEDGLAVDDKVEGQPQGQPEHAHGVLDELVGASGVEPACGLERVKILGVEPKALAQERAPLGERQLVEAGDAGRGVVHGLFPTVYRASFTFFNNF